jgi:hypothetical protein
VVLNVVLKILKKLRRTYRQKERKTQVVHSDGPRLKIAFIVLDHLYSYFLPPPHRSKERGTGELNECSLSHRILSSLFIISMLLLFVVSIHIIDPLSWKILTICFYLLPSSAEPQLQLCWLSVILNSPITHPPILLVKVLKQLSTAGGKLKMKDGLDFFVNRKRPHFFCSWKTTQSFS